MMLIKKLIYLSLLFEVFMQHFSSGLFLPEPFSKYPTVCQTFDESSAAKRKNVIHIRHHNNGTLDDYYNDGQTADSKSGVYDQMLTLDTMDLPMDSYSNPYRLGQCTLPQDSLHVYSGVDHFTPYATTVPTFIKRTSSSTSSEFRDIMGGASVNVLGLFGASAKVRVTESIKRSGKTMLIISKYVTKTGFVSRLNAKPNVEKQKTNCKKAGRHYYVSDIMLGAEDYTFVELEFDSEQKRKETEVNIKVKILFFTISKTIRNIKQSSSQNLKIKVVRVSSFPSRHNVICDVTKASSNFDVVKLLEDIEKQREDMQRQVTNSILDITKFHAEYFLTPCPEWNRANEKKTDPLATELDLSRILQQEAELENVKKIIDNDLTSQQRGGMGKFRQEVETALSQYKQTKRRFGKSPLTQSMADQLMAIYGVNNAPYHYKVKLNSLLNSSCKKHTVNN